MVFNSASKYKSIKYSWQKMQAPLRRPSMVEALIINSISGMLLLLMLKLPSDSSDFDWIVHNDDDEAATAATNVCS